MRRLEQKVAIVTGASRGIGAATARRLAADGAKVVVNYMRSEEAANRVVADIQAAGGEALGVRADVADEAQVRQLFEKTVERFGRLDILVNNAGFLERQPLGSIDRAHFQRLMDINLWSVVTATQEAARRFGPQGGRIINMASVSARQGFPSAGIYSAAKGAIEAFTRVSANELGPRGVTVNALLLGTIETDMLAGATPQLIQALVARTPLGRMGQPADVADVVAFLASEDGRWVTGQVVGVSGGLAM
jgi:3-oxoacyl-[acyl-carrier protein] reductase